MKWIAYNDSVHGPFPSEEAANRFALEQGYVKFKLAETQVSAWAIVGDNVEEIINF